VTTKGGIVTAVRIVCSWIGVQKEAVVGALGSAAYYASGSN